MMNLGYSGPMGLPIPVSIPVSIPVLHIHLPPTAYPIPSPRHPTFMPIFQTAAPLPRQSNCLGGSQQECGRPLAIPFLAKLCASTAAVPALPAQYPRQGSHNREGSPMMGTPHKASLETDGKPQGSSRKVGKVILLACKRQTRWARRGSGIRITLNSKQRIVGPRRGGRTGGQPHRLRCDTRTARQVEGSFRGWEHMCAPGGIENSEDLEK
ncbi:hypothetical protein L3Q82_013432 [Scortum barcoo]|uniref:Uncharacterized protein n=1 Tax=Scortum barcoo TaxID=214431 RepID=A0ACB8W375_9TELE|nr:hypothetical protein L3Q82_013432 [Scortum barcoo]